MRLPTLVCFLLLSTSLAAAPYDGWSAAGPWGGSMERLVASPDGARMVAIGWKVYTSVDSGATWRMAGDTPENCHYRPMAFMYQVPQQPVWVDDIGTIRMLCNASFDNLVPHQHSYYVESTDFGATWNAVITGTGNVFTALAVDPADPHRVAAYDQNESLGGAVYRYESGDGGATWTSTRLGICGEPTDGVMAAAYFAGELYELQAGCIGAVAGGLYRRVPWGRERISPLNEFNDESDHSKGLRIASAPGRLLILLGKSFGRSADNGVTWTILRRDVVDFEVVGSTLWTTNGTDVFVSHDLGDTFTALAGTSLDGFALGSVRRIAAGAGNTLVAATERGMRASASGGAGWRESSRGISEMYVRSILASSDGALLNVGASTSTRPVSKSIDGGATWLPIDFSDDLLEVRALRSIPWANPVGHRLLAAGASCASWSCQSTAPHGAQTGLFFSDDDGLTFSPYAAVAGLPSETSQERMNIVRDIAIGAVPGGGTQVYLGTSARPGNWKVMRGDGATWQPAGVALPTHGSSAIEFASAIALDAAGNGRLYASVSSTGSLSPFPYESGVYRSDDYGSSWSLASDGIPMFMAGSPARMPMYALHADRMRPGRAWVATQLDTLNGRRLGAVYRTTDGASSWQACGDLPDEARINAFAQVEGRPNTLLLADSGDGVDSGVWVSEDACRSWTRVGGPPALAVTVSGQGEILAGTYFGIWKRAYASDVLFGDDFD